MDQKEALIVGYQSIVSSVNRKDSLYVSNKYKRESAASLAGMGMAENSSKKE